ncbi:MAG TPA: antitoxin [Desulfurivibrio alkaliphilus]|uniref:Antitoxin n=1 Tax=Desulfurivibrio alkaliphilus TaxID=427923 RepID=A0A7C2XZR1_9BACT|nr:antitoxin [Desulfurivibrio alkaliphilus]
MKSMTLRGIDPVLAEKLAQTARQSGKSMNLLVLEAVRHQLGLTEEKPRKAEHHDLDHLFGRWSEDEFKQIQGKIDTERRIDPELWS